MYNRTLNRPMFRRGGRAGGGIMTGVQRQGYQGTDNAADQRVEKLEQETSFLDKPLDRDWETSVYLKFYYTY